jgi:hypothetical protein
VQFNVRVSPRPDIQQPIIASRLEGWLLLAGLALGALGGLLFIVLVMVELQLDVTWATLVPFVTGVVLVTVGEGLAVRRVLGPRAGRGAAAFVRSLPARLSCATRWRSHPVVAVREAWSAVRSPARASD